MNRKDKPVVLVCGLGRCGSSLTMQMLYRGGLVCLGRPPAFEVEHTYRGPIDPEFLADQRGNAVKLLDPHHNPIDRSLAPPALAIWLHRDARQQARSQMKFAHLVAGMPKASRAHVRRLEAGLANEEREALLALKGLPIARFDYEELLTEPLKSAERLAAFLRPWWSLDVASAASAVRKRETDCAEGLDMELSLLAEWG